MHPNNISKEDNFIEEEIIEDPFDEEGSFLMKLKHEEVCKNNDISQISKNQDSFSFCSQKKIFGIFEDLENEEEQEEMSADSIHLGLTNQTKNFFVRASPGSRSKAKNELSREKFCLLTHQHIRIKIKNFDLNSFHNMKS